MEKTSPNVETNDPGAAHIEWPEVTWYKHLGLRKLYAMMPFLYLTATIRGYDSSLLNGLQTIVPWQNYFNHPTGARLGLMTAILNIGSACAIFIAPYVADLFGRKLGTVLANIMIIVGVIIQVVPGVNYGMFIGGRFLVGFGTNIGEGCAPLLIIELAHPQHRGKVTTLFNALWYLGAIVSAWTCFGSLKYSGDIGWRLPVALQVLFPCIQVIFIWIVPESPRWLIAKDRGDKAFDILVKYHANGDRSDQFVQMEYNEIRETIRLEKENSKQGWNVFFKTPGNRKRVLLILLTGFFAQCSGNGLISYYLHSILNSIGITDSADQALINGGIQIWSFLLCVSFAFLVDRVGRKPLFLTAGIGMLVTFSVWTGLSAVYAQTGNNGAGSAVVAMIFLFNLMAAFAWPGLTVSYTAEIMPYSLRAKGLSLVVALQAVASILNQYINPIGLKHIAWKFYFVYIVILVIEVICIYFVFVETKGSTLEELAVLFDGADANVCKDARNSEKDETTVNYVEHA